MKNGRNYDAWKIDERDFPAGGTIEEHITFFVRYGILAPSTHNIQPWNFEIKKNVLKIFPDVKYALPLTDPTRRGLFVSLGACTTNIVVAAAYFTYEVTVTYNGPTEKNFFISLHFKRTNKKGQFSPLFPSLVKRYSNKLSYRSKMIDQKFLKQCKEVRIGDATVRIIEDTKKISQIAQLHKEAIAELMTPSNFRAEIAQWLRYNNTKKYDGMPGFVVGLPSLISLIVKQLFPLAPSLPKKMAQSDCDLIKTSPSVAIIVTEKDTIFSYIDVGRVYELIALKAAEYSISTTPMAALIENRHYTSLLADIFGVKNEKLQFFFRLGYSSNRPYHTPRIPLEQVLR